MADITQQYKEIVLTENGTTVVTPDPVESGIPALTEVKVIVNQPEQQSRTITITENGEYTPTDGVLYSKVISDVQPETEEIECQKEGTYLPSEGKLIDKVTVNIIPDITGIISGDRSDIYVIKPTTGTLVIPRLMTGTMDLSQYESIVPYAADELFKGCRATKILLPKGTITSMSYAFNNCPNLQSIEGLDTSNVTDMSYAFYQCPNLRLGELDLSNCLDMSYAFGRTNIDDTLVLKNDQNVVNWRHCFRNTAITKLPNIHIGNNADVELLFYGCQSLNTNETDVLDLSNAADDLTAMFADTLITVPPTIIYDPSKSYYLERLFQNCPLVSKPSLPDHIYNISSAFAGNLWPVIINDETLNLSECSNAGFAFAQCPNLESLSLTLPRVTSLSNVSGIASCPVKLVLPGITSVSGTVAFGETVDLDLSNATGIFKIDATELTLNSLKAWISPTSNVKKLTYYGSENWTRSTNIPAAIEELNELDFSNVTNLEDRMMFPPNSRLRIFGGFKNLGKSLQSFITFRIDYAPNLTKESIVNILNGISEISSPRIICLSSTQSQMLTDEEKQIATDKGWTVNIV